MAVGVPSVLTSGGSDTDAIDYATASITPAVGKTVIAAIGFLDLGAAKSAPTCSGCGLTWTQMTAIGGGTTEPSLFMFRASGVPTTGAVTFTGVVTAGQTADGAVWVVFEMDNTDLTTTDGVIQTNVGTTNTDSLSITLAAFRDAESATVGVFVGYDNAGGALDFTVGSGFTEALDISQAAGGDTMRLFVEYKIANDTGVDCTISAANDRISGLAMEVGNWKPRPSAIVAPSQAVHRAASW